jgi:rhodanese-related sulfurtransferase
MEWIMEEFFNEWGLFIVTALFIGFKIKKKVQVKRTISKFKGQDVEIIDVRSEGEFTKGSALNAINIPLPVLETNIQSISTNKPVLVCCSSGSRSSIAVSRLKKSNINAYNVGNWRGLA